MPSRILAVVALLAFAGCPKKAADAPVCAEKAPAKNIDDFLPYKPLTSLVRPLIGTANSGNVDPSAMVPHGVVRLGPDTNQYANSIRGYEYGDTAIEGFSHTHLEGAGGSAYGYANLLVVPTRGAIATTETGYASPFDHATEKVEPGYYAVDLTGPQAHAEVTATRLCGVHRYTFSGTDPGNVLLDLSHTRGGTLGGRVEVVGNQEFRGTARYQIDPLISFLVSNLPEANGTTGERTIYFHARFSRPFDAFGTWENGTVQAGSRAAQQGPLGAYATFQSSTAPVELTVCLSAISEDQAEKNTHAQIGSHSFDDVKAAASESWNKVLNRVQVEGGTPEQQQLFYTGLYRTFGGPADYTEDCQFWNGEDGVGTVLSAPDWHYYTDDWCMWDTFRTVHPLQTLLEPERRSDIVRSILVGYERGGWLTKCSWAGTGYSRVMTAIPFAPIIADAYDKGFRKYDTEVAWKALKKAATEDAFLEPPLCGYLDMGTPPEYVANGYVSHECDGDQSASLTLEYAYDDWTLSRMADGLGKTAERDQFRQMATNYQKVFNPAHGFMQGRHAEGDWVEPFDPARGPGGNDFTEATSWTFTWMVPHDFQGLLQLLGGPAAFVAKLDEFFDGGHHDAGNEQGFGAPYAYVYGGAPAKTQKKIRDVLAHNYSVAPGGLPGNDDSGAMSSYYVWGALGLYPISPGDDTLIIGSPMFDRATIYLEPNYYGGKTFVVEAKGNSADAPYIQSATLNGQPLNRAWLKFGEVTNGGVLSLQLGATPSTWGTDQVPPSMTKAN
jgi:predicted alpha-1,2-mannosidase